MISHQQVVKSALIPAGDRSTPLTRADNPLSAPRLALADELCDAIQCVIIAYQSLVEPQLIARVSTICLWRSSVTNPPSPPCPHLRPTPPCAHETVGHYDLYLHGSNSGSVREGMQNLYQPVVQIFVYTSHRVQTKNTPFFQKAVDCFVDSHIAIVGMVYRSIWI